MEFRIPDRYHFLLLKLHSLTGIVPVGLFLVVHLAFNSLRTVGASQYQFGIDLINNIPFLILVEIFGIYVPLLFHSLMGFYLAFLAKPNIKVYRYPRNALYTLQRATGAIVFVFLVYHVGTTFVPKMFFGIRLYAAGPFLIDLMNQEFETWGGRIIYLIGIFSATFHFANGLWGFCVSWGIIVGRSAQRNAGFVFAFVGLVLTFLGVATVWEFSVNPVSVEPNM